MSTSCDHIILWGVQLPFNSVTFDQIEDDEVGGMPDGAHPGGPIGVVYDGMGGNYVFIGAVIYKATELDGFREPVKLPLFSATPVDAQMVSQFMRWKAEITKKLDDLGLGTKALGLELGWYVLTHWR